jgi:eukaryotic-like serine/threonine-protein kinase
MAEPQIQRGASFQASERLTGTIVGRFAIRSALGKGGMGEVYLAQDTKLGRPVALKRMAPRLQTDEGNRRRFLHEARFASRLSNPHIASIYDVIEEATETFLVMEYVDGETLRQRLRQPMTVEEFLPLALQSTEALAAAHELGILHLDLKPENIMLARTGEVKILDFGLARHVPRLDSATTDHITEKVGRTPAYASPEVLLEKEPDPRSDIFSLGVVFYEMLAGKNPFRAESVLATSRRILEETPPPLRSVNSEVPQELESIVAKMVAKDPAKRYRWAAEVLADLRAVERGSSTSVAALPPRPARRRWIKGSAISLLSVVLLGAGAGAIPSVRQRISGWLGVGAIPIPQERQLAVLPFEVVGGDPGARAFGDGLTETLTAKLTQLTASHALQVISASEVRSNRVTTAGEARQEFGVNLILEGSLSRSGDRVRVNYSLVDTRSHRQLAADSITAAVADPFAVQDQVVNGALRMLDLVARPPELRSLDAHGTQVPAAYSSYLQGRGYLQNYDKAENLDSAIAAFERALALDPNYALAYAGLGQARWEKYQVGHDRKSVDSARQACQRALVLDENLAAAHVCMGQLESGTGEYEKAVKEFERALAIEPTNDDAYRSLSGAYESLGQPAKAEETCRRAIDLRPQYWAGYNWLGAFYYREARYADAATMFSQVVALAPDSFRGYSNLGAVYYYQGDYTDSIAMLQRSIDIRPSADAFSNLGSAHFYLRQYGDAVYAYEKAVHLNQNNYILWLNLADGYYWDLAKRAQAPQAYKKTISLANKALRVNPRDAYSLGVVAYCYAMLGERKPALDTLEQGLKLAPQDSEMRFKAALIYNQFGDTAQTLAWLSKALAGGFSSTIVRDTPNLDLLRPNPKFEALFTTR